MALWNDNTVLMLHCNGTDTSTSFPDDSDSTHTVTANGNAQVDTAQKKFGTGSVLLDGTGDYLTVPDSADWDFGTGDYTIDFWIRFASVGANIGMMDRNVSNDFRVARTTSLLVSFLEGTDFSLGTWNPNTDVWIHIAITRAGNTLRGFVDGTENGSADVTGKNVQGTDILHIGQSSNGTQNVDGWMDEIRIIKGEAVWTANFTPATDEYRRAVAAVTDSSFTTSFS